MSQEKPDRELNPTHKWGRRPILEHVTGNQFRERYIPCCLNCLVDGYDDEPEAFKDCHMWIDSTESGHRHGTMVETTEDGPGGAGNTVHPGPTTSSPKEKR